MSGTIVVIAGALERGQLFQDVLSAEDYTVDYTGEHHVNLQKIEQATPNLIVFDFALGAETYGSQLLQMHRDSVLTCAAARHGRAATQPGTAGAI